MKIDCIKIYKSIKSELINKIEKLKQKNIIPNIVFIEANNNIDSKIFLDKKLHLASQLKINAKLLKINNEVELINTIKKLNDDNNIHGIFIQFPLNPQYNIEKILETINCKKDVDCISLNNLSRSMLNNNFMSATNRSIFQILDDINFDYQYKKATIINRSLIIGKPLSQLLTNKNMTVTLCHSKSKQLIEYCKNSDLLIVACHSPCLINENYIKDNSVVINIGANYIKNKVIGDVDIESVKNKCLYTSTLNGIGPLTVLNIFMNLIDLINTYQVK